MAIDVNLFDLVEVKYIDENDESKVEFFSGNLGLAKEFITEAIAKRFTISSIIYFIELMISDTSSPIATQPNRRFGEHYFTVEEILALPDSWVQAAREAANQEIDAYMAERYGASLSF